MYRSMKLIEEIPQILSCPKTHTSSTSWAAPSPVVWFPKIHNSSQVNDDDMVMVDGIFCVSFTFFWKTKN